MHYDTVIVGGGSSGMAAALAAAGWLDQKDGTLTAEKAQKVLLIDHLDKIGRKILVTGNGRCNLTNLSQKEEDYRGENPQYAQEIFAQFGLEDTLSMFSKLGIYTRSKDGYLYPYNEQAASVRELFQHAIDCCPEISVMTDSDVQKIKNNRSGGYLLTVLREGENGKRISCQSLILATGGLAGVKLGNDGSGYTFAKSMGHRIIPPLPSLTALKSGAPFLKKLSGVRNQAKITLKVDGREAASETGELQWTNYGISGVAVFQLSRFAIIALEEGKKVEVSIDCLPDMTEEEVIRQFKTFACRKNIYELLIGFFPEKLAKVLARETRLPEEADVGSFSEEQIKKAADTVKHFLLKISGYVGYEKAQTTRGGVDTEELTTHLESKLVPGLFFAGELVDIDGTCGGYNLQWAFSSGAVAGRSARVRSRAKDKGKE